MVRLKNINGKYLTAYKQINKIYNKRFKNNINKTVYKKNSFNPNNPTIKK